MKQIFTHRRAALVAVTVLAMVLVGLPALAFPLCGTPTASAPAFARGTANTLTWSVDPGNEGGGYVIEVASAGALDADGTFADANLEQTVTSSTWGTSHLITGLSEAAHFYHVRATVNLGSCNAGDWSNAVSTTQDATAPAASVAADPPANAAGWHKASFVTTWTGTDSGSGVDSCRSPVTYAGPDTATDSWSGTCVDKVGNVSAPADLAFKYDATAPSDVAGAAARMPDDGTFYTAPVTINFSGTDAMSGIASCTSTRYIGPDGAANSVSGSCTDVAGNVTSGTFLIDYHSLVPTGVVATPDRAPDVGSFYTDPVTVTWSGTDPLGSGMTCTSTTYSGPDGTGIVLSGACANEAGSSDPVDFVLSFDSPDETAPDVIPTPSRGADDPLDGGFYTAPFSVAFLSSDPTATCTPAVLYSGPDTTSGLISGSCTDQAGNSSGTASFSFKYDATGPTLGIGRPTFDAIFLAGGLATSIGASGSLSDLGAGPKEVEVILVSNLPGGGAIFAPRLATVSATTGTWEASFADVPPGRYSFFARGADRLGRMGDWQRRNFTVI